MLQICGHAELVWSVAGGSLMFLDPFRAFFKSSQPDISKNVISAEEKVLPPLQVKKAQAYIDHTQASVGPLIELSRSEARFPWNPLEIHTILTIPDLS